MYVSTARFAVPQSDLELAEDGRDLLLNGRLADEESLSGSAV
jgi:hypothetical protein